MATDVMMVDAGGVLFNNLREDSPFFDELCGLVGVPVDRTLDAYTTLEREYETGEIDVLQVIGRSLRSAGAAGDRMLSTDALHALYLRCVRPNTSMFELLRAVRKERQVRLVLANNEAERWDRLRNEHFGHFELFDVLASSWVVAEQKPSRAFFDRARARSGEPAAERVLVVDDCEEVIAMAMEFGFQAHLFRTTDQLATVLRELAVLSPDAEAIS